MSVLLETSAGDIVIDLLVDDAPQTCLNFLKLCKVKYYNFSPIYNIQKDFSFQTGDPIGPGQSGSDGGSSIWGKLQGASKKYFESEFSPKLKHSERGTVSMATAPAGGDDNAKRISGSQFLITLGDSLDYLDGKGSIFGRVVEGFDTLEAINSAFCDDQGWPLKDIRIRHTIILDDPFDDPSGLVEPPESPIPTKEQLATVRISEDEDLNEEVDEETAEMQRREREARAQALTLEMVGDLPFADVKPPENVLFVCKLNPVTQDEDLELIFSRFGKILSCEVIRDQRTGDSLQYAFIEFETQQDCEQAYFKMDGVLIDDHRIHVDFSQSVSRLSDSWRMDTNAKRRAQADSKGYGGSSQLQRKQQYKSGDGGNSGKKYDMVFDSIEQSRSSKDRTAPRRQGDGRVHRSRDSNGYRGRGRDRDREKHTNGRSHKYRGSRSRSPSPRKQGRDRRHSRDKYWSLEGDRTDRYEGR
ncbi:Peptidyl-prolyl cis-trans isomerase cyp6 [Arthrobotrys conoides]|uniref:Peptidyl-prolyl cis-trans isomerase n=1 Tax=Arthrobotrys conoides TaxID=74498 RepID=A0AAN8P8J2_9PEZI